MQGAVPPDGSVGTGRLCGTASSAAQASAAQGASLQGTHTLDSSTAMRNLGRRSVCLLLHVAGLHRLPRCLRVLLEAERPQKVGAHVLLVTHCTAGRLALLPARKVASKCWCSHTARNSMQCNARQAGLPRCLPGSWPQNVGAHTPHGTQSNARQAGLPRCLPGSWPRNVGAHTLHGTQCNAMHGRQACLAACPEAGLKMLVLTHCTEFNAMHGRQACLAACARCWKLSVSEGLRRWVCTYSRTTWNSIYEASRLALVRVSAAAEAVRAAKAEQACFTCACC